MSSKSNRPETLFGSGQKNANRKGRGPSKPPTLTKLAKTKIKIGEVEGEPVFTTYSKLSDDALIKRAREGDLRAVTYVLEKYDQEEADRRKRTHRRQRRKVSKEMRELLQAAIKSMRRQVAAVRDELLARRIIVEHDGSYQIAEWVRTARTQRRNTAVRRQGSVERGGETSASH